MRLLRVVGVATLMLAASAARADDRSDALMKKAEEAMARITSIHADVMLSNGSTKYQGKLVLKRPNLARIEISGDEVGQTVISDGKSVYTYVPADNEYRKMPAGASGENVGALWVHQARGFFRWSSLFPPIQNATTTYLGKQTVEGAEYEVMELVLPGENQNKVKYFVSPKDHFVYRVEQSFVAEGAETKIVSALKNLKLNAPVTATAFQWKAPANAKLSEGPDYEKGLLAVGKPAPDFDLERPGGGRLALNQAIKGKKATLINFWFYG